MTEKLSNLFDKQVDRSRLDEFLDECESDPELKHTWQRYHAARAAIRNEIDESDLKFDVASKVMSQLESEQVEEDSSVSNVVPLKAKSESKHNKSFSTKPWLSLALAASMLVGIYFVINQPVQQTNTQELLAENAPQTSNNHWQTDDSSIEDTLNKLLVEHSEFTSVTGMNGMGSYSKFIAYQN